MKNIVKAQRANAELFRRYAKRAPWNSNTRREWLKLAEAADSLAKWAENQLPESERQ